MTTMTPDLQDAVTLAEELRIRPMFTHWCPSVDAPINEFDPAIIDCRCYTSREFFAAQDAMAVKLDSENRA